MNRRERRKANKGEPRLIATVTREIFTTPNLGGREVNLDIERMRAWAEENIEPQKIPIDAGHVKWLVESGSVTEDRVMGYSINQIPKPILICEHPEGLGDEIVDGNHTYVAAALSWAQAIERGMASMTPFVVGYGLTPAQWRPFVVPTSRLRKRA